MSGTIVLGIGNRLGGDDAAGTLVVDMLNERGLGAKTTLPLQITAIDAGTAPESYTSVIRRHRPDLLILVDAAEMGLPPGALRIIGPDKISALPASTHSMPLSIFVSYVREFCGKVVLVGVQPGQTQAGTRISRAVHKSVKQLTEAILDARVAEIPRLE
jgi:hydrogenase 3 maturation protease